MRSSPLVAAAIICMFASATAHAQSWRTAGVEVAVEGASVWPTRADVRIPPDGGTEFSVPDIAGTTPAAAWRVELGVDFNERHGVKLAYAPLHVDGSGTLATPVFFAGETFAPAVTTAATYKFNSYRATYRYRFFRGDTWSWRVGFTAFVRDARIALDQHGRAAEDTDVGFVPLGYLSAEVTPSPRWRVLLEVDGSAAPQGRAFDVVALVGYRPTPWWEVAAGYRTIEGGADVDTVYTFAWFNAAVVRTAIRF